MASNEAQGLFRLAAELRAELSRIDRTVSELEQAAVRLGSATGDRLVLYGAAALLETFYTGIEKGLTRVALAMGGLPSGATWHRTLLEDMTLSIPQTRPAVLSEATVAQLDSYLAFRHRFRNLYLFDLEASLLEPLLRRTPVAWAATRAELNAFCDTLAAMAGQC